MQTKKNNRPDLIVVGGGLAGSEAAWQAAQRGLVVHLYEMRPHRQTGAHTGQDLAELVCSNSLGSDLPDRAPGLLKVELRRLGSLLLDCAQKTRLPAGGALAVDRQVFAHRVTEKIENHPRICVIREEVKEIPDTPVIIASGPLTSPVLTVSIRELTGQDHLYFYDAIAPIVSLESIDMGIAFRGSRYGRGDEAGGDYINCPMTKEDYTGFVDALLHAERIPLHEFERELEVGVKAGAGKFFEGCLPVEILARRGELALAYGPMRPVGLEDRRQAQRLFSVVQLRQDNLAGTSYNLVGFQTNLKFSEQRRVFQMIPGLEHAEFLRYGQMHRNTFVFSPALLAPTLECKKRPGLFFAGQITGIEGYAGNIASGLLAGWNAARLIQGKELIELPRTTMLGALCHYITHAAAADFQPMKANFGILPPLENGVKKGRSGKQERNRDYIERALAALDEMLKTLS